MWERDERRPENAGEVVQPRAEPPAPHDMLLALQRGAGNQSIARALAARRPLSRFVTVTDYTFGAGAGEQIAFQSHGLEHATGTYTRTTKRVTGGGLETQRENYDPQARDWQETGRAVGAAKPALKVSANGRIAVEPGGQANVMYIDPELLTESNLRLAGAKSEVRLMPLAMTITFPNGAGARTGSFTLRQAAISGPKDPIPQDLGALEKLDTTKLNLQTECHNIAAQVISPEGELKPPSLAAAQGAPTDQGANPHVGQAFHYKAAPIAYPETPFATGGVFGTISSFFKNKSFQVVMTELNQFDQVLKTVGEGVPLTDALAGARTLSSEAKGFVPGWGDHSEGVVARDGADALTLVNYNRATESSWVISRLIREAYRANQQFRTDFEARFAQLQKAMPDAGGMSAEALALMLQAALTDIQKYLDAVQLGDIARRVRESATQLSTKLWYFDLYGPADQSFHAQYETLAGRGGRADGGTGTTTVRGTAAPAPVPVPQ